MNQEKLYSLPDLPYGYKDLGPYISEEQLRLHHQKHHQAYVNGANIIFEKLEKAKQDSTELDVKAIAKELSFQASGHLLHSLFWENLQPASQKKDELGKSLEEALNEEFGSMERFKKLFTQAAVSVEGSGWAILVYCQKTKRPIIVQAEKHNVNVIPAFSILMVLDVWEHAYYLDYKNERAKFIEALWQIINWETVTKRLEYLLN